MDAPHQLPAYVDAQSLTWRAEAGGMVGELEDKVRRVVGTRRELLGADDAMDVKQAHRHKLSHLGEP